MSSEIFVAIPSYADPDLPWTLDSAIRASSGAHDVHLSVCEQVTRYGATYCLDRTFPDHVEVSVDNVGNTLIGLGAARSLAEAAYSGEDIQLQVDAHTRFVADWDKTVVRMVDRLGDLAVVSSNMCADPWSAPGRVPVVRFDHIRDAVIPFGEVDLVEPDSGRVAEVYPSRTIMGGSVVGAAWCREVPADPHIVFSGEEPTMAARLWTHGRELWHGRVPWHTSTAGDERPSDLMPWSWPEWDDLDKDSMQRVLALLTGKDGKELERYGLGPVATLEEWMGYSGIDYRSGTVKERWPTLCSWCDHPAWACECGEIACRRHQSDHGCATAAQPVGP